LEFFYHILINPIYALLQTLIFCTACYIPLCIRLYLIGWKEKNFKRRNAVIAFFVTIGVLIFLYLLLVLYVLLFMD
jgi:hypothetical protein